MKVVLYWYRCKNAHCFKTPQLTEQYGKLMLRSDGDALEAWVDAPHDPVFSEVARFAREVPRFQPLPDRMKGDIVQSVFSMSCDLAPDGTRYVIGAQPRCPYCNTRNMDAWWVTSPPEVLEVELRHVLHNEWAMLPYNLRRDLIHERVEAELAHRSIC